MENPHLTEQLRGRRSLAGHLSSMFSVSDGLQRTIYDTYNSEDLPGTTVLVEYSDRISAVEKAVYEAFRYSGDTYDFYKKIFNRNSVDGRGMRLESTVHYGNHYNNAFWNGTQMVYGDGDQELFNRFTSCVDVVGHEITHGVTQFEAALEYQGQSGALNESFSDVFGTLVKQYTQSQNVDQADWLIGDDLFIKKGVALRSMKDPGSAL